MCLLKRRHAVDDAAAGLSGDINHDALFQLPPKPIEPSCDVEPKIEHKECLAAPGLPDPKAYLLLLEEPFDERPPVQSWLYLSEPDDLQLAPFVVVTVRCPIALALGFSLGVQFGVCIPWPIRHGASPAGGASRPRRRV
jgi:hypothetical protein